MQHKNKRQKTTKQPAPAPLQPASRPGLAAASSSLIRFDKKTKIFIAILLALYFLMSVAKLHNSSIGNWNKLFGLSETENVLAGEPRYIRMDEWMTSTPALIGHVQGGLHLSNKNIGDGNAPIIWGFPIKDISSVLRPSIWPYFIFDTERAFAFSWNFNIFFFLLSTFLLLMLLTKNQYWLSVWGTFFLFFSSGVQWWSYSISTAMMFLNGGLLSIIYLLYSQKIFTLIRASGILIICTYGFLFNLYPPFQVPLVYLYAFIFIGYILRKNDMQLIRQKMGRKLAVMGAAMFILAIFLLHYYSIAKDTFSLMMNTVYPGKREAFGGDLIKGKLFSEFFGVFMNDTKIPSIWQNICEESGFLMFFPIIFYAIGMNYYKSRKFDYLQLSLSFFMVISIIYLVLGFPAIISRISFFSLSEARRFLPVAEAGNCILLICYLGEKETQAKNRFTWMEFGILTAVLIVFFMAIGNRINEATSNFFTSEQVNMMVFLFTLVYLLVRFKFIKYVTPLLCSVLLLFNFHHVLVNPIMKGLSPLLDNPLAIACREIKEKDPEAGWAVIGENNWADLLKSVGLQVFNGVKLVPPLTDMNLLDKDRRYDSVYNRYAHISINSFIPGPDSVVFQQTYQDAYTIYMDPCSPKFRQLGVRYFVFTYVPKPEEIRCMSRISENSGFYIYKRNDP